ncbi:MAG TPA: hypothetical protein VK787_08160 [Puia sp.]|jgi:hypothetical protein|nr:hypothetical protein [Puia sp.]
MIWRLLQTICLLWSSIPLIAFGQSATDSVIQGDTTFTLKNDTLFTNSGFNIFTGQKLLIGKASDQKGHYQSISFKSSLAFPLLFLRDTEIKNNVDYQLDPTERDKDKVKETLIPGQFLIVKKIKSIAKKKKWHYYLVYLYDEHHHCRINLPVI